jgi:hypothetical protein
MAFDFNTKRLQFHKVKKLLEGSLKKFSYKPNLPKLLSNDENENENFIIYSQMISFLSEEPNVSEIKLPEYFKKHKELLKYELDKKNNIIELTKKDSIELFKPMFGIFIKNRASGGVIHANLMYVIGLYCDFIITCLVATRNRKYFDILYELYLNLQRNEILKSIIYYPFCSFKKCNFCNKTEGLKQCKGCRKVCYCCVDHQNEDWENHKKRCNNYKYSK